MAFANAWRDYAHAHPGRYTATQIPIRIDPELAARAPGPRRAIELTYSMLRAYALTEPDLTDAVRLVRSTLHGFVSIEAAGGFTHARPARSSWVRCLDALHTLLENWPASRRKDPARAEDPS